MSSAFVVAAAPALRAGLRAMLEQAAIHVTGEASALSEPGSDENAVLVLAGELALEDLPELRPVVLLSADARQAAALRTLGLPGWALLPPEAGPEQLAAAVNAAAQRLAAVTAESASALAAPVEVSEPLDEPLTPRELEVLQLVSHGLSNKLIARALNISEHTVKFHVSSTYAKLGAASRTEAVSLAARKGLISL